MSEEIIRAKGILDGAETMEQAVKMAEEFAIMLREMQDEGWVLDSSYDDYMIMRK